MSLVQRLIVFANEDEDDEKYDRLPASSVIKSLRNKIATKAQHIYDHWKQDEDDELNGGGICHLIADEVCDVLSNSRINCSTVSSNHEVHVYTVAQCSDGVFEVDIPYNLYERGGGYTWHKIPNIKFSLNDVVISKLDGNPGRMAQYVDDWEDN